MSLHNHNSSANRGACKQNCRKKYTVIDQETGVEMELDNEYIMSPKDLCTIDILDQVADAGIKVLKIEGRGRAPEYVAKVIKCYRDAIDSISEGNYNKDKVIDWMLELERKCTIEGFGMATISGRSSVNGAKVRVLTRLKRKFISEKECISFRRQISESSSWRPLI